MFPNATSYAFRKGDIAFLTKHEKEKIVAPLLEPFLGTKVRLARGFDTDELGTFTKEIARISNQLETAKAKALKGMELTGLSMGLGSEGSFAPDPYAGFITWNVELLAFIDAERGLEVTGAYEGPAKLVSHAVTSPDEAERIALSRGFPDRLFILRPGGESGLPFFKDMSTRDELRKAAAACFRASSDGVILVESDLRAHACPERRETIRLAAVNLLMKLHSLCPSCRSPGFWVEGVERGLPCARCGRPSAEPAAQLYRCRACGHAMSVARSDASRADPAACEYCNP